MKWALPASDNYFAPMLEQDPRGFQIDHLELALKHCKQFRTAVDGGAHIGTWSAHMAKRFAKVMAFEPAQDTFQCLSANLFDVANVEIYNMALGPTRCTGTVIDDPTRPGNTGARYLQISSGGGDVGPLDEFDLQDLDFLKLDVEGYELHALRGARDTLHRCKPVVLIEVKRFKPDRFGVDPLAACRFLKSQGFREVSAIRNDRIFIHAP